MLSFTTKVLLRKVAMCFLVALLIYLLLHNFRRVGTASKGDEILIRERDSLNEDENSHVEKITRKILREQVVPEKDDVLLPFFSQEVKVESTISFLIEPLRIVGKEGILALREIQGNSWSGSIMKAVLITFVQSEYKNPHRRDLVRRTWASVRDINGRKLETVFVIKLDHDMQLVPLLEESYTHGDLLIYKGGHRQYTENLLSAMEWASTKMPGDFYSAFCLEDYLVNINAVKDFILMQRPDVAPHNTVYIINVNNLTTIISPVPQVIYCFGELNDGTLVRESGWESVPRIRDSFGINAVWPPHCNEHFFASSVHMIKALHAESKKTADANIDPVLFITGVLRKRLLRGDENIVKAKVQDRIFYKNFAKEEAPWLTRSEEERTLNITSQWKEWLGIIRWQHVIITKYL